MGISDYQLMELAVDALFTHDPDGSIRRVDEPDGDFAPRFFLGRTAEGSLWRFRFDLHPDTRRKLAALAAVEPVSSDLPPEPHNLEAFLAVLGRTRRSSRSIADRPIAFRTSFPRLPKLRPSRGRISRCCGP